MGEKAGVGAGNATRSCTEGRVAGTRPATLTRTKCSESHRKWHEVGRGIQMDFYVLLHVKMQSFTVSARSSLSQWSELRDCDLLISFLDPPAPFSCSEEPVSSTLFFSRFLFGAQRTLQRQFLGLQVDSCLNSCAPRGRTLAASPAMQTREDCVKRDHACVILSCPVPSLMCSAGTLFLNDHYVSPSPSCWIASLLLSYFFLWISATDFTPVLHFIIHKYLHWALYTSDWFSNLHWNRADIQHFCPQEIVLKNTYSAIKNLNSVV